MIPNNNQNTFISYDEEKNNSTNNKNFHDNSCYLDNDSVSLSNDDYATQVELSHASTTNQPTIYQGSSDEVHYGYGTRVFCFDLVSVGFLFVASTFMILLCFGRIPVLNRHFKAYPNDKVTVLALTSGTVTVVFMVVLFRCVRRAFVGMTSPCCHRQQNMIDDEQPSSCFCCCEGFRERTVSKPYDRIVYRDSNNDQTDGGGRSITSPPYFPANTVDNKEWTPGLNELSDEQLEDVRNILTNFLLNHDGKKCCVGGDNHDAKDWLFSPSTVPTISQRGGFIENQRFRSLEESVKLRLGIKLILVGHPNVGKTSIFHRILYDRFSEYYMATLGADLAHVCLHLYPGQRDRHLMISLQLWDIAGSERLSELARVIYRDATAFVVVCDITHPDHLVKAEPWVADIMQLKYEPYVALFRNKVDLGDAANHKVWIADDNKGDSDKKKENDDVNEHSKVLLDDLDKFAVSAKTGECLLENVIQVLIKSTLHEIEKLI